ncbi:hypothetical protein GOBAR_DD09199 [Gossypium barbadense]|nr:hypothetical protein GOBAR_DD09199 [Gossypium barbadense]
MPEDVEYRCFIGNLSWSTSDRGLKDAFEKFGNLIEAKVAVDKISGRSRGFGFISFDEKAAMEEAIEAMNGMDLDGRNITVDRAKPQQGSGRDYDAGMQVVVGDLEVIDTIVIDLDPMTVVELGVLVLVKMTACADELGCCFLAKHEVSFLQNVLSSLLSGWNNIIVQSFEV